MRRFAQHTRLVSVPGKRNELVAKFLAAADIQAANLACELMLVSVDAEVAEVVYVTEIWTTRDSWEQATRSDAIGNGGGFARRGGEGDEGAGCGIAAGRGGWAPDRNRHRPRHVLHVVAEGIDAGSVTAGDVASRALVAVGPEQDLDEALELMARNCVRRLRVVEEGRLVGMLAQADVALEASETRTGELLEEISQPTSEAHI
jgi:hypothetical protein